MGDDEKAAAEIFQKLGDPLDGFRVQMVRRFVEHQKIRTRNDGAAHGDAAFFPAGQRFNAPVAGGTIQMRHRNLDAAIYRPPFERRNAGFEFFMAFGVVRKGFELGDEIQNVLRPRADVVVNIFRGIEHEILRQVTGHEVALAGDFAAVRMLEAGEQFEERGFATAVAADKADAVTCLNPKRGGVEDGAFVVTYSDLGGGNDGGHGFLVCRNKGADVSRTRKSGLTDGAAAIHSRGLASHHSATVKTVPNSSETITAQRRKTCCFWR